MIPVPAPTTERLRPPGVGPLAGGRPGGKGNSELG